MNLEQLATELTGKPDLHILELLKEIGQDEQPIIDNYLEQVSYLRYPQNRRELVAKVVTKEAARRWRLLIESGEVIEYSNQ